VAETLSVPIPEPAVRPAPSGAPTSTPAPIPPPLGAACSGGARVQVDGIKHLQDLRRSIAVAVIRKARGDEHLTARKRTLEQAPVRLGQPECDEARGLRDFASGREL
jgi:hypothetical protein